MNAAELRSITVTTGSLACSPVVIRDKAGRRFEITDAHCEQVRKVNDKGVETMDGVPVLTIQIEELK